MSRRALRRPRVPSALRCLAATVALAAALAAQGPTAARFRLRDLDGVAFEARVLGFADGVLSLAGRGAPERVALDDLSAIEPLAAPPAPGASGLPGAVWLRSGLELPLRFVAPIAGGLRADVGLADAVDLPLLRLRALRFDATDAAGAADPTGFVSALDAPARTEDLLFAHDRQRGRITRLPVRVLGFDGERLKVEFRGRENTLPIGNVQGVVFGLDHGIAPAPLARPYVEVRLADARTIAGRLLAFGAETVAVQTAEELTLEIPTDRIAAVAVRSAKVAWLSELEPTAVEHVPAFDHVRPWLRDATPAGPGLALGTERYDNGLCLVPRTRLTWTLEPGQFDVFDAILGIDARAGDHGNAVVRVLVDGNPALVVDPLLAGAAPLPIRVAIRDATSLSLEADFGPGYDLGDHCVFARARVLRQ
ncbi:MAG: NPCBM/NEW2 domain-containing protein [Planctomycetes bacterium]|nr:NPCBM/NEW2 domain-containing protein [Planctomycetota bacterium]